MKKLLNSSTSLTLCMALVGPGVLPTFAAAQSSDIAACGRLEEQKVFPCAVEDGTVIEARDAIETYFAAQATETETVDPAAEPAEAQVQAVEEEVMQADEKAANAAAAAEKIAAEQAQQEAQAAAEKAQADAEQAAAEATKQAEAAEEQSEADAAKEAELKEALAAEQAAQAQQAAEGESAAEASAETEINPDAEDKADPASEAPEPTTQAEEAPAPDAAPTAEAVEVEADNQTSAEVQDEAQPLDEEAQAALDAEREAERSAERQAAQEAARKALEEEPAGEVVTEEVTTENTRRSDEDFETNATGAAEQTKKDDGLSNLEKALLLGLGAAVVGTVLKNGDKVLSNSGDRVVVQDEGGQLRVLKDDDALLRRPGDQVRTEQFNDGSTRQIVEKSDGSKIVTIRGADGTVLRRISINANGGETILFDDLAAEREIVITDLPRVNETSRAATEIGEDELRSALIVQQRADQGRSFSLRQIREIGQVRALAPPIELDAARFATGSAAIEPDQARNLSRVGNTMRQLIADDPRTVFLIEGHTDAVGDATYNLALSDRRAETIALALTEYFDVPPENMITQGYGESALKVRTTQAEQANRRAVVRNITDLLRQASN